MKVLVGEGAVCIRAFVTSESFMAGSPVRLE